MFKIGDKVVCIKEPIDNSLIVYGNVYTIECVLPSSNYFILEFIEIKYTRFSSERFISLIELRKNKINKLKECLK
jgi:hypothetical protein